MAYKTWFLQGITKKNKEVQNKWHTQIGSIKVRLRKIRR
jgi:hypothetical protein